MCVHAPPWSRGWVPPVTCSTIEKLRVDVLTTCMLSPISNRVAPLAGATWVAIAALDVESPATLERKLAMDRTTTTMTTTTTCIAAVRGMIIVVVV
jgi:hypothetical protein